MNRIYRIRKGSFTMKNMKVVKLTPGAPVA